jgi:hypothetical protein
MRFACWASPMARGRKDPSAADVLSGAWDVLSGAWRVRPGVWEGTDI